MTLDQIYNRIDELLDLIHKNSEDQDCVVNCEMELASLEQMRENFEENESGDLNTFTDNFFID